jgi:hypothetical protein
VAGVKTHTLIRRIRAGFLWLALGLFSLSVGTALRAASREATLLAIHEIENPRNLPTPGRRGELGAYQFRYATWKMHTDIPFYRAVDKSVSDVIAVRHYEWLKRGLERARLPASPYNIALAWNSGLAATVAGRSPRVAHRYAERARNLADEFDRSGAGGVAMR